ncbi:hypothetical protein CFN78_17855 [Amycolatopsis antarctica]|uniref:Uncharacterized protein n=1 Tax=Amycolatopsis antarctica TaxID=1854586 RepID=A0A263D1C3_9PSEU|nr:hypothetical protein [Amycolatopsis antarctica]OZM71999.1 hypothetical protein CFN78_17855 [Amycolatopsis antarctica]
MEAQSYHQKQGFPVAVRTLVITVAVLILVLIALPVQMILDPSGTTESVVRNNPPMSPAELDTATTAAVVFATAVHAVFAAVAAWLTVKVRAGRQWARVTLTVLMIAAMLNGIDSATAGGEFLGWAVGGIVLAAVVAVLLWLPATMREFFARHRDGARQTA